jgi:hypothetical protein
MGPSFGGVSVRPHAHTPKSGVSPQEFPETHKGARAGSTRRLYIAVRADLRIKTRVPRLRKRGTCKLKGCTKSL